MAMMDIAMFNAVNAIEPHTGPTNFKSRLSLTHYRKLRQAALCCRQYVLVGVCSQHRRTGRSSQAISRRFPTARRRIVACKLGEDVASKMLELRADDGSKTLANAYRPDHSAGSLRPYRGR